MQAAALVLFYTTQAQQLLVREGLPLSPPTAGLRDCQLQGSQESMLVPQCSHPCGRRAPSALPWQPLPLRGSLGTDKAGTMLAAQQPGSLLGEERKSSKSSYGDQAGEMDWGKRGELPWESSAKPPALHRDKPAPFLL